MKILIVAATPLEIQPLVDFLTENALKKGKMTWFFNEKQVEILMTGVGIAKTAYQMGRWLAKNERKIDLIVNVGVAGFFKKNDAANVELGTVVELVTDMFGDLGVEEADGKFIHMHALNLVEVSIFRNPKPLFAQILPQFDGSTVQKVHGTQQSIDQFCQNTPNIRVETMEGAAFFEAVLDAQNRGATFQFSQIRAISNYVEPRNRENWQMKTAINNLNAFLIHQYFQNL